MARLRILFLIGVLLIVSGRLATAATIGEARGLPDGAPVSVAGCLTYVQPNECYVQSTDRSSGIWVAPGAADIGCAPGELVSVSGTMATTNGERLIGAATVFKVGASSVVRPIAMRNNWLGGSYTTGGVSLQDYVTYKIPGDGTGREWRITRGAPNTGLLVTTWGTVKGDVYYSPVTESHWFYVDDGSGVVADCGEQGIIVYSDADVHNGDFVTVTGISSVEVSNDDATRLVRSIRPRLSEDVRVAQEAAPEVSMYPFSDEFESEALDTRWIGQPAYSLTTEPGSIALGAITIPGYGRTPGALYQQIPGNWDLEVKIRPRFHTGEADYQGVYVRLARYPYRSDMSRDEGVTLAYAYYGGKSPAQVYPGALPGLTPMTGDTCWFRIRMRRPVAYVSVSLDGANYLSENPVTAERPYLEIYGSAGTSSMTFSPLVDYVRFTRIEEGD